ncbi:MAG: BrnA antitoxin family protein, partial [Chloroflexota bacterium]
YSRDNLPKDTQTDWARVDAMTEEEIDAAARSAPDAQPIDENMWEEVELVFPGKQMVCIRIDQDVLDWFRSQGRGYQTRMNAILRSYMEAHTKANRSRR